MIADEGWRITIHGGFAWVFGGDKDNTGTADSVTVGPYRKPAGNHAKYHPHRMVLRVPEAALNTDRTTLKGALAAGHYVFQFNGDVTLNKEATGTIERVIHERQPDDWNSFYWVYDGDRFRDRSGKTRTRLGDWQQKLDSRLLLYGGRLRVLAPRFPGVYEMTFDGTIVKQPLATHIEYFPRGWASATTEIEFRTGKDLVAVRPRLADGRPTALDIAAECGCLDEPDLGEIAGFDITFDLYATDAPAPKFTPKCTGFMSPNNALMPPGPDCPPRSYSI
jgi:hypothetical protein